MHTQHLYPLTSARPCAPAAQVSPHEFMQAVMATSGKRFVIDRQADPVDFLSWFLNALHADLTGGKRKKPSVVTRCFQVRTDLGLTQMSGVANKNKVCKRLWHEIVHARSMQLGQAVCPRSRQQVIISSFQRVVSARPHHP